MKPAVVFVHGMRTSHAIWTSQEAAAREAGYATAAVDLPGHGTRLAERFTMQGAFDVIDEAIAALGYPGRVALVGLSLGGYTSLAYAARFAREHLIAGLVVSGCSTDPKGKPITLFRDVAAVAVSGAHAVQHLLGHAESEPDPNAPEAPAATSTFGGGPHPSWQVVTDALTQLAGQSSLADLRAVTAPVWIVNGAHDPLRLEERQSLTAARSGALVVIPGAGHDVNSEAPEAFNQVMLRALAEFTHLLG